MNSDGGAMRACEWCGGVMTRLPGERPSNFRNRLAHPGECRAALINQGRSWEPSPPKECIVCRDEFERRDGERKSDYDKRETCGVRCGRKLAYARRKGTMPARNVAPLVLHVLEDYRGMPLTVEDLVDETRCADTEVRRALRELTAEGAVRRWPDPEPWRQGYLYAAHQVAA